MSSAWTTSMLPRNRWKLRRTSSAVPSCVASEPIALIAARGSAAPIAVFGLSSAPASDKPRSMSQVASDQLLLAAQPGDLDDSVVVLERLDPDAREAGAHVLRQTLGERHEWSPSLMVVNGSVNRERRARSEDQVDCLSCWSVAWPW